MILQMKSLKSNTNKINEMIKGSTKEILTEIYPVLKKHNLQIERDVLGTERKHLK